MKKTLAIVVLLLAALPSLAAFQRIKPQYRIGNGKCKDNSGGRITMSQKSGKYGYVDSANLSATANSNVCVLTVAKIPAGLEFKKWWYYYNTSYSSAVTNTTALGRQTDCAWKYNAAVEKKLYPNLPFVCVVADYDYIKYKLKYNGNGATSGKMTNETYKYTRKFKLTPNAFKRTGYTFKGWTNATIKTTLANKASVSGQVFKVTHSRKTATLYAKWAANKYTVKLNQQGGSGGTGSVKATFGSAMPSVKSSLPARKGYVFGGYYTAAGGKGTQYYKANGASARSWNVAGNTTLYAKWTGNQYAVTLDLQGGVGTGAVKATFGSAMPTVKVPTRAGYTFGGYYAWKDGSGTQYYRANGTSARNWDQTAARTLYAKWTVNQYKVTFDANEGSVGTAAKTVTYADAYGELPTPTRGTDYEFDGWWTAQSGGSRVSAATVVTTAADHTLYAHWTAVEAWDNGELSQAMHCDNLRWVQDANGETQWEACVGEGEGYASSGSSISNLVSESRNISNNLAPSGATATGGTLSFRYRTSADEGCWLTFAEGSTETDLVPGTAWKQFGPVSVGNIGQVRIAFNYDLINAYENQYTVWIDQMTWEPAEVSAKAVAKTTSASVKAAAPAAAPAAAKTAAPAVGVSLAKDAAGGIVLKLSNVSDDFDYQILATSVLTGAEWPVVTNVTAAAAANGIRLDSGEASMFFKVRAVPKE